MKKDILFKGYCFTIFVLLLSSMAGFVWFLKGCAVNMSAENQILISGVILYAAFIISGICGLLMKKDMTKIEDVNIMMLIPMSGMISIGINMLFKEQVIRKASTSGWMVISIFSLLALNVKMFMRIKKSLASNRYFALFGMVVLAFLMFFFIMCFDILLLSFLQMKNIGPNF